MLFGVPDAYLYQYLNIDIKLEDFSDKFFSELIPDSSILVAKAGVILVDLQCISFFISLSLAGDLPLSARERLLTLVRIGIYLSI